MLKKQYNQLIADRINSFRIKNHLTIEALAYQSGISKGGLSEILKYKKAPTPYTIGRICAGLQITHAEFYSLNDFDDVFNNY